MKLPAAATFRCYFPIRKPLADTSFKFKPNQNRNFPLFCCNTLILEVIYRYQSGNQLLLVFCIILWNIHSSHVGPCAILVWKIEMNSRSSRRCFDPGTSSENFVVSKFFLFFYVFGRAESTMWKYTFT